MPKVSEEHFEQKRQQILAAARRVCESKPLYSVTMKDIVLESGMSQGGVYKYFANIDAVYVAILNEATLSGSVQAEVDAILGSDQSPWAKLDALFAYLGGYVEATVGSNGKLFFELMVLYRHEPARFQAIRGQLVEVSVLEYLQQQLSGFLLRGVADGTFAPVVPMDDLFRFVMTSLDGITQEMLASQRAGGGPPPDAAGLVGVLGLSVRLLLGGANGSIKSR